MHAVESAEDEFTAVFLNSAFAMWNNLTLVLKHKEHLESYHRDIDMVSRD